MTRHYQFRPSRRAPTMSSFSLPTVLFLVFFCFAFNILLVNAQDVHPKIDPQLLQQAVDHSKKSSPDGGVLEKLQNGDIATLHKVAKSMYQSNPHTALDILHSLAEIPYIPSQVALGFLYYEQGDLVLAIKYFAQGGENGPHQAALYNAGRIHAESGNWLPALAYIRAAATLNETHPSVTDTEMTETCIQAFHLLCRQVAGESLTIVETADLFLYGNLQKIPGDPEEEWWTQAVKALVQWNETAASDQRRQALDTALLYLRKLWEEKSAELSRLQAHLVLRHSNTVLAQLSALDDVYLPAAAGYAEALAMSLFCYHAAAEFEDQASCFNEAVMSAMSYNRQSANTDALARVMELARTHPEAATRWKLLDQTPRIYYPDLTSKPWWDANSFSLTKTLTQFYQNNQKEIQSDLNALKTLSNEGTQVEMDMQGEVVAKNVVSFAPITSPGVRSVSGKGWDEFGPLFNGRQWNESNCQAIPTICKVLQESATSFCTSRASKELLTAGDVAKLCGDDIVVTIYRLQPGTTILPRCGMSNAHLLLHWCLEGCQGVQLSVGGVTREYNSNGSVLVFDDSFEHSIHHGGKQDQYIVRIVLPHPDQK